MVRKPGRGQVRDEKHGLICDTNVDKLRELCSRHSLGTHVSHAPDGLPEWVVEDGRLRNTRVDYFSIGLYAHSQAGPLLLMEQKETALVTLLAARVDGRNAVLLSLRTEPGLIGLTNFSSTIQSTPSNYRRRHGGKSTPFIQIVENPSDHGRVVYDGLHYDWGEYYLHKKKRFLIVELDSPVEVPMGFCWVPLETAQALLLQDDLVTNDLRVSLPLLSVTPRCQSLCPNAASFEDCGTTLRNVGYSPSVVDCRGTAVSFFKTTTEKREVSSWVQPLLIPKDVMAIRLPFTQTSRGRLYAVEKRTQPGLLGRRLWFPATKQGGQVVRSVRTSAEGGRFWKFPIEIDVVDVTSVADAARVVSAEESWLPEDELSLLIAQSCQTSLELRMAWSLVYAGGLDVR